MIFSIYNDHVIVFDNTDHSTPSVQTFYRPTDWFRNPAGFYLNISTNSDDRSNYRYPPANFRDKNVWNVDMTPHSGNKPVAIVVSHAGCVYTLNKAGKHLATAQISDIVFGQNVLVSADVSTSYIGVDATLAGGNINDIDMYIRALQLISKSSTQGSYAAVGWYCTLKDFKLCLDEAGEQKFNDIAARWQKVDFSDNYKITTIKLGDISTFNYNNFAGFKEKEPENV